MNAITSFIVLFIFSCVNGIAIWRRLRLSHPEVWAKVGAPSYSQSNVSAPRLKFFRFVWRLGFRGLHDPWLGLLCWVAIGLEIALASILVWMLIKQ